MSDEKLSDETSKSSNDKLILGGKEFSSRFIMGSGKFDPAMIEACVKVAGAQIITLALRRANEGGDNNILNFIPKNVTLLPNTSGARNADEAVRIALLARELGCGNFIKLEVINDTKYLLPNNHETLKAVEILAAKDFVVLPYMHADLNYAKAMQSAGAAAIMPLASPIGSNMGLVMKGMIEILVNEISLPIIVDAGLGRPSQACEAMEMGCAAVMVNTAIATAGDISLMALAFAKAVEAGRSAFLSGFGSVRKTASASSPLTGFLRD
ncbi:MAG: thiazole synthase [Campylobacter sp.]|nr:thiazole synthase [Campylobacter sp.]